jgi:GT2 family glycosyltransferase
LVQEYADLPIQYQTFKGTPSAAAQRNAGLAYVDDDIELIGFVDDDIVFEPNAIEKMLTFWQAAPADVCGAAFNLQEEKTTATGGKLKHSGFSRWLGLYDPEPGAVAPSGWHTRLGAVKENTKVEWLISGAVLWRKEVLLSHQFDTFFRGYSYLEDLDFSYGAGRNCQLVVVADAVFQHHHHHENLSPDWYYRFGQMEVRNRLYFVRKYGLSVWRCYLGLCIRFGQTLMEVIFKRQPVLFFRAGGNLLGLWKSLFMSNPHE